MLPVGKVIKTVGTIGSVNISSVFSELIQAAGMGCESFASDLFYDLTAIKQAVDNCEEKVFYVGIRTNGVDGTTFIRSRLGNFSYGTHNYIKVYRLSISIEENDMTVSLERISEYDARNALCEQ